MTKTLLQSIHIMTARLAPGDAISNFVISSGRILRQWGHKVHLYADSISPQYGAMARPSHYYPNSGQDILWFHYSIYADNVEIALSSNDYKVMDFHGICPPELFAGQNNQLARLCQSGYDLLPSLNDKFDSYIVHSEYSRHWLERLNFPSELINKIFYCLDTSVFTGSDEELMPLLARLDYFLMVGRIVPQKDILALIEIFGHIQTQRPESILILVGSREQTNKYQHQIEKLIAKKGLQKHVLLTGQVSNPAILEALFRQAQLLFVTSEWESFCVPIAESLHFGVPVVVHDLPPLPEIAGAGGLVVDKQQPKLAAAATLSLLDNQPRYEALARSGKQWAEQYSDKSLAANIKQWWHHLAQR